MWFALTVLMMNYIRKYISILDKIFVMIIISFGKAEFVLLFYKHG